MLTKTEIEIKYPIGYLFDLLDDFVNAFPLEDECNLTKAQIHALVAHTKIAALSYAMPRYDIFTITALEIKRKMIDGNFCTFNPLLCGWAVFYRKQIVPQYNFEAA